MRCVMCIVRYKRINVKGLDEDKRTRKDQCEKATRRTGKKRRLFYANGKACVNILA